MDKNFWLATLKNLVHWLTASPCRWLLPVLTVFVAFPGIDLVVSGWFFFDGRFFLRHYEWFEFIRAVVPPLTLGGVLFAALLGIAAAVFHEPFLGIEPRRAIYLLLSLVTGPGLLTNSLFKEYWGRARPSALVNFGGDRIFTPAVVMSDQCTHNCSFVSGHAALAFWTVAFALLIQKPWRRFAITLALLYGILVGFVRVAQGSHFLSDVVFAAALSIGVVYSLHRLMLVPSTLSQKKFYFTSRLELPLLELSSRIPKKKTRPFSFRQLARFTKGVPNSQAVPCCYSKSGSQGDKRRA